MAWVSASVEHQSICGKVLGPPSKASSLDSYKCWDDVQSLDLVELFYQIEEA